MGQNLAGRGATVLPQLNLAGLADKEGRLMMSGIAQKQKQAELDQKEEIAASEKLAKLFELKQTGWSSKHGSEINKAIDDLQVSTESAITKYGARGLQKNYTALGELMTKKAKVQSLMDQSDELKGMFDKVHTFQNTNQNNLQDGAIDKLGEFLNQPTIEGMTKYLTENMGSMTKLLPPEIDLDQIIKDANIQPIGYKKVMTGTTPNGQLLYDFVPEYSEQGKEQISTLAYNVYDRVGANPIKGYGKMPLNKTFKDYTELENAMLGKLKGTTPKIVGNKPKGMNFNFGGWGDDTKDITYQQSIGVPIYKQLEGASGTEKTLQLEGYTFNTQKTYDIQTDKITFSNRAGYNRYGKNNRLQQGVKSFKPTSLVKEGNEYWVVGSMWRKADNEANAVTVLIPFSEIESQLSSYEGISGLFGKSKSSTTKTTKSKGKPY